MFNIIATPIGNMGDISQRAKDTIAGSDYLLTEDTRTAGKLLTLLGIEKIPFISFHEHNEKERIPYVLDLLKKGKTISMVSEGGTPLISDPGYRLISRLREDKIAYTAVPGACAVINALVLSGFPTDSFYFVGFLPIKTAKRKERMETVEKVNTTVIFYESPYKIHKLLDLLKKKFADRQACVIREMTKIYEEVDFGTIEQLAEKYKEKTVKGEITVVMSKKEKAVIIKEDEEDEEDEEDFEI